MKKLITVLMIMMMCIAAAACGGADSEESSGSSDSGSTDFPAAVEAFETSDLDGNQVTNEYFANADVTIVHIWATYCGPCLEEMGDLAKMAGSLPENAQVLGIVADVASTDSEECELAQEIVADNSVRFTNVVAGSAFDGLFKSVMAVPTTFIVDKDGNIMADPIIGSGVDNYKSMAEEYLAGL